LPNSGISIRLGYFYDFAGYNHGGQRPEQFPPVAVQIRVTRSFSMRLMWLSTPAICIFAFTSTAIVWAPFSRNAPISACMPRSPSFILSLRLIEPKSKPNRQAGRRRL
jgi:hypothetical protein